MAHTLGDILGSELEEDFKSFDLSEIQEVLGKLRDVDAIDLSHAELLQQQALRGADVLSEYLAKIVKTVGYLEAKVNSTKNRVSLDYKSSDGTKTTTDMKIWAGLSSPDVEEISLRLSKAKASKIVIEKKYDLMIATHHHYKSIAQGMRKSILGYGNVGGEEKVSGWE